MIKPMLAQGSPKAFNDDLYIWERKHDGDRILPFVNGSNHYLQARSGTDKTDTFPELRLETRRPAILDSEVVSATGLSFQNSMQHRINRKKNIAEAVKQYPAKLVVFDLLEIDGRNVEHLPLLARKELLSSVVVPTDNVEVGLYTSDGLALWDEVITNVWEGLVGKRKDEPYLRHKRRWLKVKAWKRNYGKDSTGETFLVIGYTKGTGWRESTFGALVVARLESDGSSTYIGEIGTGFDVPEIKAFVAMFHLAPCPWSREPQQATWVRPIAIYAQYLEYTNAGMWRIPSFKGIV